MVNPTDHIDQALANLWANTRPKATDVLIRNLRAHAYSYAMDDPKLCEDLRQAIGRLEHPSSLEPKQQSIIENKYLEHLYWNIRAVLENAQHSLVSPHILWSDLNELMEVMPTLEKQLDIPNCWQSTELKK